MMMMVKVDLTISYPDGKRISILDAQYIFNPRIELKSFSNTSVGGDKRSNPYLTTFSSWRTSSSAISNDSLSKGRTKRKSLMH